MYDQLNQGNLIGILAETFGIFVPSQETLIAHLEQDHSTLYDLYKKANANMDE